MSQHTKKAEQSSLKRINKSILATMSRLFRRVLGEQLRSFLLFVARIYFECNPSVKVNIRTVVEQ